jgi:hypothetical protein
LIKGKTPDWKNMEIYVRDLPLEPNLMYEERMEKLRQRISQRSDLLGNSIEDSVAFVAVLLSPIDLLPSNCLPLYISLLVMAF